MTPACARVNGKATPLTRKQLVKKCPKSVGPDEYSAEKSSAPAHREKRKFGKGAKAKIKATKERRESADELREYKGLLTSE